MTLRLKTKTKIKTLKEIPNKACQAQTESMELKAQEKTYPQLQGQWESSKPNRHHHLFVLQSCSCQRSSTDPTSGHQVILILQVKLPVILLAKMVVLGEEQKIAIRDKL